MTDREYQYFLQKSGECEDYKRQKELEEKQAEIARKQIEIEERRDYNESIKRQYELEEKATEHYCTAIMLLMGIIFNIDV